MKQIYKNETIIDVSSKSLKSLNLFNNPDLKILDCQYNQLKSLNLSQNPNLEDLDCKFNQLKSLNLSQNPNLKELWCSHNHLKTLNLSQNPKLLTLDCGNNQLKSINLSQNPNLRYLFCYNNPNLKVIKLHPSMKGKINVKWEGGVEIQFVENQTSKIDINKNEIEEVKKQLISKKASDDSQGQGGQ